MQDLISQRIEQRFEAFEALAETLSPEMLEERIELPKHKTLGEHFWCVIGARESYTRAIEAGVWSGFHCSLDTLEPESIVQALRDSARKFQTCLKAKLNPAQSQLLLELLEHEVMHEGQMIRHLYALGYRIPASWRWARALSALRLKGVKNPVAKECAPDSARAKYEDTPWWCEYRYALTAFVS